MLINTSIRQVYLRCRLPSVNDYMSHLQDATTVQLVLLACQLKIIRAVLQ